MANKNLNIVPLGNGWAIKKEGSKRFTVITETQKEAINAARKIAQNSRVQIVIHGKDGRIKKLREFDL